MMFGKEARKCNQRGCKLAHLIPSSTFTSSTTSSGIRAGQPLKISAVGLGEKRERQFGTATQDVPYVDCGVDESTFLVSATDKRYCASSVPLVSANSTHKTWGKNTKYPLCSTRATPSHRSVTWQMS